MDQDDNKFMVVQNFDARFASTWFSSLLAIFDTILGILHIGKEEIETYIVKI